MPTVTNLGDHSLLAAIKIGRLLDLFGDAPWVSNWLTPIWLIALGAGVGLLVVMLLAGVAWLLRGVWGFSALAELKQTVTEGPLLPIFSITVLLATFSIVGFSVVRYPSAMIEGLLRWPALRAQALTVPIDAPQGAVSKEQAIPLVFRRSELQELRLSAKKLPPRAVLSVSFNSSEDRAFGGRYEIKADKDFYWQRGRMADTIFPDEQIEQIFIVNEGVDAVDLEISVKPGMAYPEMSTAAYTAVGVIAIFLLYALQRAFMPRISAVALVTYKSESAQPLFLILMSLGLFGIVLFEFIPYYTLGEDIKMLKMSGLTLIMLLTIVQAVWAASNSISEEVDGRTALTVLSKPLTRRDFILGKYLGILWTVAVMFMIFGITFLIIVAYKPLYDATESAKDQPVWQQIHGEMIDVVPGLILSFMETAVLGAISVAISTRLPMLANFIISFAVYVLGHLTPLLVQTKDQNEIVRFFGKLIATVFPVLEYYDIQAGIAGGARVPLDYLAWMLLYTFLYSAIALLLALILFEDRDLA